MLPLPPFVALLALAVSFSPVAAFWSLAEDVYAFPKYRVAFLNGLPVANDTVEQWLAAGLRGGEPEFLGQPWREPFEQDRDYGRERRRIDGADGAPPEGHDAAGQLPQPVRYRLERLRLGGINNYICLIPPPVESHMKPVEEPQLEANPAQTWSLLQPLSNHCIFHRQGWFTYSYCHNNQVRQFRELAHPNPHHAGFVPEEDHEWEAFTLGQAATILSEGREITTSQQSLLTNSVEIVKSGGHRYLRQKWGDGTICDKTGRPREVEVQFHCSQIMTDTILFVKETSTCHYIMVIHTPRLCGEPGFKTRLEQREEALIRCRGVVDSEEAILSADRTLPEASSPFKRPARPPVLDVPLPVSTEEKAQNDFEKQTSEMIKRAVQALFNGGKVVAHDGADSVHVVTGNEGDVLIEFVEAREAEEMFSKLEERLNNFLQDSSGKRGQIDEDFRVVEHEASTDFQDDESDGTGRQRQQGGTGSEHVDRDEL